MPTLHTINKAPSHSELWSNCLAAIMPGDSLLCIEAAVYATLDTKVFDNLDLDCVIFLQADLVARGLTTKLRVADDSGFVDLACSHTKTVSWY